MAKFKQDAIIRFSEKNKLNVLNINKMFNIPSDEVYKTSLHFVPKYEGNSTPIPHFIYDGSLYYYKHIKPLYGLPFLRKKNIIEQFDIIDNFEYDYIYDYDYDYEDNTNTDNIINSYIYEYTITVDRPSFINAIDSIKMEYMANICKVIINDIAYDIIKIEPLKLDTKKIKIIIQTIDVPIEDSNSVEYIGILPILNESDFNNYSDNSIVTQLYGQLINNYLYNDGIIDSFFVNSNFRINSHQVFFTDGNKKNIEIIKESNQYPITNLAALTETLYTEQRTDAIYVISLDKYDDKNKDIVKELYLQVAIFNSQDSCKYIQNILLQATSEVDTSCHIYKQQGNIINHALSSFMLLRTTPKLTGNIKLVVDSSYKLYLDTFKVSSTSILNKREYRKQYVSADGHFSSDIKKVFGKVPKGVLFDTYQDNYNPHRKYYDMNYSIENIYEYGAENNTDSLYSENMKILAPLYIGKNIPDYFCIFRSNMLINKETYFNDTFDNKEKFIEILKNAKVVKIFDLRKYTTIGQYLNNYKDEIKDYLSGNVYLQFIEQAYNKKLYDKKDKANYLKYNRQGINTWHGISVDKGILVNKTETTYFSTKIIDDPNSTELDYNLHILNGFSRNNILYPNIINLEYMFNDNEAEQFDIYNYFGLYLTENQFVQLNYVTKDIENNNIIYQADNKQLTNNQIQVYLSVIEDKKYIDRLFFISTDTDICKISSLSDINTFTKKHICNMPGNNLCHAKAVRKIFKDDSSFITMKFTKQISYGEHFKFIILHYSSSENISKNILLEVIASNDIRLKDTTYCINPYISTNALQSNKDEIYRITFYTQDVNNPLVPAPLNIQLQRLLTAINKFGNYIYANYVSSDSLSVLSTIDTTNNNTIYFQHISNEMRDVSVEKQIDDYIYYFQEKQRTQMHILHYHDNYAGDSVLFTNNYLELTGDRYYDIISFMPINSALKYNYYEIYSDITNIINSEELPLINTVKGYYPLNQFDVNEYNISENDDLLKIHNGIFCIKTSNSHIIISPFNTNYTLISSIYLAHLSNSKVNICAPKSASVSIMGISNIKDINTYINYNKELEYNSNKTYVYNKGDKLYFDNNGSDLQYYTIYCLKAGNIEKLPMGNNIKFIIIPNYIIYQLQNSCEEVYILKNYLLVKKDNTIIESINNIQDTYNYITSYKSIDELNYYLYPKQKFESLLKTPIVPSITCVWKSNGEYFDHNQILYKDVLQNVYYQNSNIPGNFIENMYKLGAEGYDNMFIPNNIETHIHLNETTISYKDFILNKFDNEQWYKYPIRKFIIQKYNPEIAIGTYNKYVQQLEFIYYGIKFILKFNDNIDTNNSYVQLQSYNNYEIMIINDYNTSNYNEIYISTKEEFILIINHTYISNSIKTNANILLFDNNIHTIDYNWFKAPYNLNLINTAKFDESLFVIKKTNNNKCLSDYILQYDLDIYPEDFSISTNMQPYYAYIKTSNETYYRQYDLYDTFENSYSGQDANHPIKAEFMIDNYSNSKHNLALLGTTHVGSGIHTLSNIFSSDDTNYRQINTYMIQTTKYNQNIDDNISKFIKYKQSIINSQYMLHIISDNAVNTYDANECGMLLNIDIDIPVNIKYNNGYFNPDFADIFEFNLNDDISDIINMDCLLSNTSIKQINNIPNYTYNKVLQSSTQNSMLDDNANISDYINYYMDERNILSTNWDNNIYRLYTSANDYTNVNGYIFGINDKMFMGSKCIILKEPYIIIDTWLSNDTIYDSYGLSEYNQNANMQETYNITINITKAFHDYIAHNQKIYNIWKLNINNLADQEISINNYINYTFAHFYNLQNTELSLYRKYDINKKGNIFDKKPEDLDTYEDYTNIYTTYKVENGDIILYININDYKNYYYYPVIKIYKY